MSSKPRDEGGPVSRGDGGVGNRDVFDHPEVVAYYATRTGLTDCERAIFTRHLRYGTRILDLGVGAGRTVPYLSSIAGEYVGVDYAPAMVEQARRAFPATDLRVGDAADLGEFPDASFDAIVFSFNGIDCLYPDRARRQCLGECRRVLRPGGVFVFSTHHARAPFPGPARSRSRARSVALLLRECAQRFPRVVSSRAFWAGSGYLREGGYAEEVTLHAAVPRVVRSELEAHGFELIDKIGSEYPKTERSVRTTWYYYAARVPDPAGDRR